MACTPKPVRRALKRAIRHGVRAYRAYETIPLDDVDWTPTTAASFAWPVGDGWRSGTISFTLADFERGVAMLRAASQ